MKLIKADVEFMAGRNYNKVMRNLERVGRVCYKSEDRITKDSAKTFIENIIKRGHEAIIEHESVTLKFIVDRGVSHELVRHRLASYAQESTRYCNYSKDKFDGELTFIEPCFLEEASPIRFTWECCMRQSENSYLRLLELGRSPQEARSVLPNSLKTELVVTMNFREWRHFFKLRCAKAAHPQMREVALKAYELLLGMYPALFEDLEFEGACQ